MTFRAGPRNLITDVAGLRVGNAADAALKSGVTVVVCDEPAVAGVQVLGGAPGTRETDLLEPHNSVEAINAVVLSGGSAFGLDAASGVQAALRETGRRLRGAAACASRSCRRRSCSTCSNGGDKDWGRYPPYRELGYEARSDGGRRFRDRHRRAPAPARWSPGSRAASARPRRSCRTASPSARLASSMRPVR